MASSASIASNASPVTLPVLNFFGLPDHVANGTNRLSVVAFRLVGTISFYREGLIDWRKGAPLAALIASGTLVGSVVVVEFGEALLYAIVVTGLLLVLGLLLFSCVQGAGSRAKSERSVR